LWLVVFPRLSTAYFFFTAFCKEQFEAARGAELSVIGYWLLGERFKGPVSS
jgi:hypothetical protein